MFAIMYFLMIRPQQKKMRQDQEMRSQLAEGDRVLLTSGIFGTIAHVGERQMIVELAPGVEITVLKGNVARKVTAEDEEFEFTDDAADSLDSIAAPVDLDSDPVETVEVTAGDVEAPNPFETGAPGPYDEVETTTDVTAAENGPGYQPWERKDGPGFEAPEATRPEESK